MATLVYTSGLSHSPAMKLYWTDVRFWLGRLAWLVSVAAAGALGGWLAGGGLATGIMFGLGYLALTRLVVLAIHRASPDVEERHRKTLWRKIRRLAGGYTHGTWLVHEQDNVLLLVRRKHGRWVFRVRWHGIDTNPGTPTNQRHGLVPVDAFYASPYGTVHRVRGMWAFREDADGHVRFQEIEDPKARCRADLEEVAQMEQAAGLTTPTNSEVQQLVDELSTADQGFPVILGCEGDG